MRLGGRGMAGPHLRAGDAGTDEPLADPPPYWVLGRENMRFEARVLTSDPHK